jgi:hypothetical protein
MAFVSPAQQKAVMALLRSRGLLTGTIGALAGFGVAGALHSRAKGKWGRRIALKKRAKREKEWASTTSKLSKDVIGPEFLARSNRAWRKGLAHYARVPRFDVLGVKSVQVDDPFRVGSIFRRVTGKYTPGMQHIMVRERRNSERMRKTLRHEIGHSVYHRMPESLRGNVAKAFIESKTGKRHYRRGGYSHGDWASEAFAEVYVRY